MLCCKVVKNYVAFMHCKGAVIIYQNGAIGESTLFQDTTHPNIQCYGPTYDLRFVCGENIVFKFYASKLTHPKFQKLTYSYGPRLLLNTKI